MSEAAQRRCADPNWVPPCIKYGFSDEARKKMSESAKKRARFSEFGTKEDFVKLAKLCKSQREMANKLGCTAANVGFLIKSWNIKEEIKNILKQNKEKL